jgi:hypothetical protein
LALRGADRPIGGKNFHKRRGDAEDRSIASSRSLLAARKSAPASSREKRRIA